MIESEFVTWEAPDGDHPVRRLSQRSYDLVSRKQKDEWLTLWAEDCVIEDPVGPSFFDPEGKGHHGPEGVSAFWDMAIAPVKEFHFTIRDSFANGNACANIGTFSTVLEDGSPRGHRPDRGLPRQRRGQDGLDGRPLGGRAHHGDPAEARVSTDRSLRSLLDQLGVVPRTSTRAATHSTSGRRARQSSRTRSASVGVFRFSKP